MRHGWDVMSPLDTEAKHDSHIPQCHRPGIFWITPFQHNTLLFSLTGYSIFDTYGRFCWGQWATFGFYTVRLEISETWWCICLMDSLKNVCVHYDKTKQNDTNLELITVPDKTLHVLNVSAQLDWKEGESFISFPKIRSISGRVFSSVCLGVFVSLFQSLSVSCCHASWMFSWHCLGLWLRDTADYLHPPPDGDIRL